MDAAGKTRQRRAHLASFVQSRDLNRSSHDAVVAAFFRFRLLARILAL
jgi:hypothetical protein